MHSKYFIQISAEASCVQQCYWYKYHRREHHSVNRQMIPVM